MQFPWPDKPALIGGMSVDLDDDAPLSDVAAEALSQALQELTSRETEIRELRQKVSTRLVASGEAKLKEARENG